MSAFHVIIPARLQSTRLANKALALIGDKPMVVHVCQQAAQSGAQTITVATDDLSIKAAVEEHGFQAVMTDSSHVSGSDRVFEAAETLQFSDQDIIVNVQGDEPFIPPENIKQVAQLLNQTSTNMATLCCPIVSAEEVLDPNAVKVIFNHKQLAIYFSRSPIPYNRAQPVQSNAQLPTNYYRHIGIYAYRKSFLKQFISWPQSNLETLESLEQLRVIEHGYPIAISVLANAPPAGVDTQQDLLDAREYFDNQLKPN